MPCFTTTSGIVVSLFVVVSSCYAQRDCSFILHRSLVSLAGKYLSRRKWWFALSRRGRGTDIVVRLTSLRDVMTLPYGSGSGGRTMQGRCPCVICNIRWAYVVLVGWAMGDGRCAGDSPSSWRLLEYRTIPRQSCACRLRRPETPKRCPIVDLLIWVPPVTKMKDNCYGADRPVVHFLSVVRCVW